MAKRSIFEAIFGNKKQDIAKYTRLNMLNDNKANFSRFNNQIYTTSQVRSCVDAIARNCAKLSPKHIRRYYDEKGIERIKEEKGRIRDLITKKPNEMMNAYDFYYKIITHLQLHNNAFVFISRDASGKPMGLYPIEAMNYTLLEYKNNVYIQFKFRANQYVASLKDDVICLKRFFNSNDILGDGNDPIIKTMSIKHIVNEGVINAIKTTQGIKGILKETKAMLKPEDVKAKRDRFVDDFVNNSNGIASIDATAEFIPVNLDPKTATDGQIKEINNEIMNYFGVNEKILQSTYTENEWNAFYENVIEPIALQLSLEFTNKIFTYGEQFHGNEIIFEANRLQYASTNSKISILKEAGALGIMTINEMREIINLSPVDDGDQRVQSLNYVDKNDDGRGNENE